MSLIKDKAYREMPFSSETPDFEMSMLHNQQEDYHQYLTLQQLIEKITKQQLFVFRCRTVGVYESLEQGCSLHDIDDHCVRIRVSLRYIRAPNRAPYAARPFTAQVFGFAHYVCEIGPVLYALRVREVDPLLAQQLCRTMKWVVSSHRHLKPDDRRKMRGRIETLTSQTTDQMEIQAEQQVLQEQPQVIPTAEQVCFCLRCASSTETPQNVLLQPVPQPDNEVIPMLNVREFMEQPAIMTQQSIDNAVQQPVCYENEGYDYYEADPEIPRQSMYVDYDTHQRFQNPTHNFDTFEPIQQPNFSVNYEPMGPNALPIANLGFQQSLPAINDVYIRPHARPVQDFEIQQSIPVDYSVQPHTNPIIIFEVDESHMPVNCEPFASFEVQQSYWSVNYGLTRPHAQPVVVEEFQHQPPNIYELPQAEPIASYEEPIVGTESLKRRSGQEESSVIAKKMRDSATNIWDE